MNLNLPLVLAILLLPLLFLNGKLALAADHKVQSGLEQNQENEYNESRYFPKKGNYLDWIAANRLSNQGVHLARVGNYKDAIPFFQQAIQRYGYDYTYYENLAVALHRSGNLERAESTTEIAAKMSPRRWSPWYNLGVILTKEHEYKRALTALRKAKALKAPANKITGINKLIVALEYKLNSNVSGKSGGSGKTAAAANLRTDNTEASKTDLPVGTVEAQPPEKSPYTTVPEVSPVPTDPIKTNEKGN